MWPDGLFKASDRVIPFACRWVFQVVFYGNAWMNVRRRSQHTNERRLADAEAVRGPILVFDPTDVALSPRPRMHS